MKKYGIFTLCLLLLLYLPIWIWMVDRWLQEGSYYSHGFLIPLMSGYLVWKSRHELILDSQKGIALGFWILLVGLFLLLAAAFWRIYFIGAGTFLVVLFGGLLYLYGFSPLKLLWFPILFLGFMIPIPLITVSDLSLQLKLLAAATAIHIIDFFGIVAIREGSYIHFNNGTMIVGDVCSGLRSLISLLAFGAFFAYVSSLKVWGKWILLLASMPIAWVANIIRILFICLVGRFFGIPAASGMVHDLSGILIFVFAFMMLFGVERGLRFLWGEHKHHVIP